MSGVRWLRVTRVAISVTFVAAAVFLAQYSALYVVMLLVGREAGELRHDLKGLR
jgi:hypothetical protein